MSAMNPYSEAPPPAAPTERVGVFGCGRSHRRDDQAGLRVAEMVSAAFPSDVRVMESEAPGADLLADLAGVELLVIIDAARAADAVAPGDCRRLVLGADQARVATALDLAPLRSATSSHLLGVYEGLCVAEALHLLPPEVWIYAIAGDDFGYGEALSAAVERALPGIASRVIGDIRAFLERRPPDA
jgi:hydrogenase maturation protease